MYTVGFICSKELHVFEVNDHVFEVNDNMRITVLRFAVNWVIFNVTFKYSGLLLKILV